MLSGGRSTLIHCFGSALNLNLHFRMLFPDGGYDIVGRCLHYNPRRPHGASGYRPPSPRVMTPSDLNRAMDNGHTVASTNFENPPVDAGRSLDGL